MKFKSRQISDGDAVLERLVGMSIPTALKPAVASAKQVHKSMLGKQKDVTRALEARDEALATVGKRDGALDGLLGRLASKIIGAEIGKKSNPFADFSKYTPSAIIDLAYATEAKEARALATAVKKTKPPEEIVKLANAIAQAATEVDVAIKALAAPQRDYTAAIGAREALIPEWTAAFDRLERRATGAWADEPATHAAVFTKASAIAAPVKRASKKPTKKKPAKPTEARSENPSAPA